MQIEEGKCYQARNGAKIGPMVPTGHGSDVWVWRVEGLDEFAGEVAMWRRDGTFNPSPEHEGDLIAEWADEPVASDPVNHPSHYTGHPSGVECIQVTEHMNFCRGNAVKYIWRAGDKGNEVEDLKKARWYLDREIKRLEGAS